MGLTVEELLEIDSAREAAISPDGRMVAFRAVAAGGGGPDEVRVVSIAAGEEVELHALAGRSPAFSPTREEVAYATETADAGQAEIRMLSLLDGSTRQLAVVAGTPSRLAFAPDGSRLALVVTADGGASVLAILAAAGGGVVAAIEAAPEESLAAPSWSPDGAAVAFARTRAGRGKIGPTGTIEVWEIDRDSKRQVATGCAYATCPAWSPDGRTLAFIGVVAPRLGAADPALAPWLVGVEGGAARRVGKVEGVLLEPAPIGPVWSADGTALYLRLGAAGAIDLVRLDLASGTVDRLVDGCQVLDFAAGPDGAVACTAITPDDPGSVHIATGGARRVECSVGAWARRRSSAIPVPEHRAFAVGGGIRDGWVTGLDPRLAPQPTLLACHGGPHGFFGPGFQGGHFHRGVLASRGWVVLALNSTGSGTYGREFADGLRGAWGERDLPEQLAALDELVDAGVADPARLAVCGYSYGGYLAAWAIARDRRFAAAVIGAPIVDLESFEATSDIGSWYTPWQMKGGLPENLERYRRLSPVTDLAAVTTPTLILHGEADRRVPVAQGELLRDRLAAAGGAEVEFVSYPGAGHLFYATGKPADRLDFNRRVVEWLEVKVDRGRRA